MPDFYNVVFTVGCNVTGGAPWSVDHVENIVANGTGLTDYTAIVCRGMYEGERETSLRFEVYGLEASKVKALYSDLMGVRRELFQKTIHFDAVKSVRTPEFIGADSKADDVLRLLVD